MSWLTFWKFLHVVCMFGAVALFVGGGVINGLIQQGKDVRAIRGVIAAEGRVEPVAGPLMLAGLIFGFVTAVVGGFSLTAPWLLVSYALVVGIILMAVFYHVPHGRRLSEAAAASSDDEPSSDLLAVIATNSQSPVLNFVDGFLWVALIFTMVVKPFGL